MVFANNNDKFDYSNPNGINIVLETDELKVPKSEVDEDMYVNTGYGRPRKDLSKKELTELQFIKDDANVKMIEESFAKGEFDEETRDTLIEYYQNGEEIYTAFVDSVNEMFSSDPVSKKYINLLEGEVDNKTMYYDEHIGPQSSMILEYELEAPYSVENSIVEIENQYHAQEAAKKGRNFRPKECAKRRICLILPMMKDVERAIEKVKRGGEYDREYCKEKAKIISGKTPEESGCDMAKLRKPIVKFRDAIRCTVLGPFYEDILNLYNKSLEENKAIKSSRKSKYLSNDTQNREEFFKNLKNYRDMKNYMKVNISEDLHNKLETRGKKRNQSNFLAEVQYKTKIQYFEGDVLTHKEYEVVRNLQQDFYSALTEGDKTVLNQKIYSGLLNIQNINRKTFGNYNKYIISIAKAYEDRLAKVDVKPEKNGTYPLVKKFLEDNLLVRSSEALQEKSFSNSDAVIEDVYNRYKKVIDNKYLVDIRSVDKSKYINNHKAR